jgi:hypothetical protein
MPGPGRALGADAGQSLLTHTAEPGSPSQEDLNLLADWAAADQDIERSAPTDDSEPAEPAETPD